MKVDGFEIQEELGNSELFRFFRGRDSRGRTVLVKKTERGTTYKTAAARLHREYEVCVQVQLPGVIRPLELLDFVDHTILVYEDPGYTPLDKALQTGPLELIPSLRFAAGLASILAELHQAGYIHRDIRPANILIDQSSGEFVLHGMGISTRIPNSVHGVQGAVFLGIPPDYISPELSGRTSRLVDYRTDLYSLGVILFEIVTGAPPFAADDPLELIHAHVAKSPPAAHEVRPEIPHQLSAIIHKLLAKSAEDRYQGGRGLQIDLQRCLDNLTGSGTISPFPLAETDPPSRFELPQRFYGRDAEIDTLLCALDVAARGKLRVLMVSGDPGIGKTTLAQELRKAAFEKNGLFIAGKYDALERGTPYSGIKEALCDACHRLLMGEPDQAAAFRGQIRKSLGANTGVIVDLAPEFAEIIGESPPVTDLEPQESKNRLKFCFQQVLRGLAQKDRPVVLFLDDLQWADLSSLELIEGALEKDLHHLLLVGTYRDNDINERHPLIQTLNKLEGKGIPVEFLPLGPLDMPDIRELVADSLRIGVERALPLADQVFRKTAGNPFFTRALLVLIYEEGLLYLDHSGNWAWEMARIAELETAGNVHSLAARKISRIPDRIRHTISLAAALGHPIKVQALATVCGVGAAEIASHLVEACRERILVEYEDEFLFRHDHLKESAYELIPPEDRPALHLGIGRFLADSHPYNVFAVLDHLNRAVKLLDGPEERRSVARLNLEAGRTAKAAAAFPAAYQYFAHALALLPTESWSNDYDLTLVLHNEAAEAAFLTSDLREADRLVCQILSNTHNIIDKIPAFETQIAVAQARLLETDAVKITIDVVKLLGVDIPGHPTAAEVDHAVVDIKSVIESAIARPKIRDHDAIRPEDLAAMRLLARAAVVVGMINHPLYILMTHRLLNLAIRYPRSAEAPVAYIMAGGILCYLHEDYENGCKAGDRGMKLLPDAASLRWEPFCHFLVTVDINCWRKHFYDLVDEFNRSYRIGMEGGDLLTASMSAYYASEAALHAGADLNQLQSSIHGYYEEALRIGGKRVSSGLLHLELVTKILSNGIDTTLPHREDPLFPSNSLQEWHECADQTIQEITFCHEIMLHCFYRQSHLALRHARHAHELPIGAVTGFLPSDFYLCLAVLDATAASPPPEREQLWDAISTHQRKVQIKARACPMNYQHKLDLLEAQRHRILGNTVTAMEYFDRAIEGARQNRYIQDEALACEMTAEFYISLNRSWIAKAYLQAAVAGYGKWGAWGKLDQLNSQYPELLAQKPEFVTTAHHIGRSAEILSDDASGTLDIASIERAAAALSRELDLPKLLKMLIGILLQNAGAQHGLLLREDGGKILIEASGSVDDATVQILEKTPIEKYDKLSRSIVRYVNRSHETVVIGDAVHDERFGGTPYIVRERPKSILCAPILHRGKPMGIIYLENNLSRDAFSGERLKAIHLISAQAAVALENARLIDGLKQEVRTRKQAEDELRRALAEVDQLKERLRAENTYLKEEILGSHGFDEIVGKSEPLRKVLNKVTHVASTEATVLILGETGTGKELIARAIHNRSPRKENPMVRVNCASLPGTLIESELFGHEKGAFTGAVARKLGRFELADGGTIFLDEIGELPLELQAKLLRILQEGEFERVGSATTHKVNVRVIAATNRDLKKESDMGTFRSDLYYRLSVFPIELPPLRERKEDIPLLVWYFIAKKQVGLGKNIGKIPKEIMAALLSYLWPGNIRELENVIERAIILSRGATLHLDDSLVLTRSVVKEREPASSNLDEVERNHILAVLEGCGWRVKGKGNAAEQLGLNPSTLLFRMKKLDIRRPEKR